jgi:hypothetical protein
VKTYLVTTAALFGFLAIAHAARVIAEWPALLNSTGAMIEAGVGVLGAALCVWAIALVRQAG